MENQAQQNQPKKKRKWLWWLVGIIGFFIIVGIFSNGSNNTSSPTSSGNGSIEKVGNSESKEEVMPEPALIELSGTGQQASQKFTLENGLSIFKMTHSGTSNFSITLMDSDGQRVELLVNEIGKFDGAKAVGVSKKGEYVLDISANGNWTIKIEQPRPTSAQSEAQTFTGIGQQVTPIFNLDKGLKTFKMKHSGKSNFSVVLMDKKGNNIELLVNEIGDFDGSKAVGINRTGLYLLDISADGEWTVVME